MLEQIREINLGMDRRFPAGRDPFQIITRLAEECGELAAQVNHFEGSGVKQEKNGAPDKIRLAKEVLDVLRCALQVAAYYDAESELALAAQRYYESLQQEGWIP
jgi:NTP pyrophosphatase (non-canonical NTP hydrolase)